MNKSQIRFAMAAHAAWIVMKNPVLTRVYMEQWEKMYPRPLSVEGEEVSLYGYVFQVMYMVAWYALYIIYSQYIFLRSSFGRLSAEINRKQDRFM